MNRLPGIISHVLKGSHGWSECSLSKIDVARVMKVDYCKRWFCLFDRNKPFTLTINYYLPKTRTSVAPGFGGRHMNISLYRETEIEQLITKRYTSEQAVKQEINDIQKKMNKLDSVAKDLSKRVNAENYEGSGWS